MNRFRALVIGLLLIGAPVLASIAGFPAVNLLHGIVAKDSLPPIDRSKLKITLRRSACYGSCPDYIVTISGDGSVVFSTREDPVDPVAGVHREFSRSRGVLVPGTHRTKISPEEVDALVDRFRQTRFFELKDEYRYEATDAPTYVVSIDTGRGAKRVIDYIGTKAGMPKAVTSLEDAIDTAAGSRRWIEGTPEVIPLLQTEGFVFNGPIGLDLMAKAAERGDVNTMARLHSLGSPIVGDPADGPLFAAASANQVSALSWLLDHGGSASPKVLTEAFAGAVGSDGEAAFDRLRSLVGANLLTPDFATQLLRLAAGNGNVRMASYFLQFHPRLTGSESDGMAEPPLWAAAQSVCPKEGSHPNCDHREVVRMLLGAGSNPRWFHPVYRNSVLFLVSDPQIARMLLAGGADPNFKDTEGEPIIFSISDEDVALVMIEAGLDLHSVRPADKMTMRGWATYEKWPRVMAKLDAAHVLKSHED